jgi:hypothetical protein
MDAKTLQYMESRCDKARSVIRNLNEMKERKAKVEHAQQIKTFAQTWSVSGQGTSDYSVDENVFIPLSDFKEFLTRYIDEKISVYEKELAEL